MPATAVTGPLRPATTCSSKLGWRSKRFSRWREIHFIRQRSKARRCLSCATFALHSPASISKQAALLRLIAQRSLSSGPRSPSIVHARFRTQTSAGPPCSNRASESRCSIRQPPNRVAVIVQVRPACHAFEVTPSTLLPKVQAQTFWPPKTLHSIPRASTGHPSFNACMS